MKYSFLLIILMEFLMLSCQKETRYKQPDKNKYAICDSTLYQDTLFLDSNSFEFVPYLQDSLNYIYRDSLGNELSLTVSSYENSFWYIVHTERCLIGDANSPDINYFFASQELTVEFGDTAKTNHFHLRLSKKFDGYSPYNILARDQFSIRYRIPGPQNVYFNRLVIDISSNESTYTDPSKPKYSENFELIGIKFKDVYHRYGAKDDIPLELHYNKEFGIVAFSQWPEQNLWVLSKIE